MQLKEALFILPLFYVLVPFILSGTFVILGGVTVISFISAMIIFLVITNLNFGGSAEAIATGGSINLGMNDTGGKGLFIVFIGGVFYLGASLATVLTPILNIFTTILNAIISALSWVLGVDTSGLQSSIVSSIGGQSAINLSSVYPLGITVQGISVFLALDAIFASMFILSLYLMVSEN